MIHLCCKHSILYTIQPPLPVGPIFVNINNNKYIYNKLYYLKNININIKYKSKPNQKYVGYFCVLHWQWLTWKQRKEDFFNSPSLSTGRGGQGNLENMFSSSQKISLIFFSFPQTGDFFIT